MLLFRNAKCLLFFLAVPFLVEVNSQDIQFDSDDNPDSSGCRCTHVRRCRSIMARPDWREVLQTGSVRSCGYRRICCPQRIGRTIDLPTVTRPPPRTPPEEPRPPIFLAAPQAPPSNLQSCGQSRPEGTVLRGMIMGGVDATQGEFPWMVAINIRERNSRYVPHCTGFLVDTTHVITAAHCFDEGRDPVMFNVKIGNVLQSRANNYTIRRIVLHEGYRAGLFYNDVAVMTLTRPVDEPNFNPICLPDESIMRMNLTGRGTTVAGWGSERFRGPLTDQLKKLEFVPVWSNRGCNSRLREVLITTFSTDFPIGINSGFICAGFNEGNKDSCGGDSGGPLMLQVGNTYYAIGVVSFGVACGRPRTPGGYTRISSHIDWIRQNTRD